MPSTADAIRGMVESLEAISTDGPWLEGAQSEIARRALACWEERESLQDDATLVLAAAGALGDARNDPRKWTNVDMAEAALDAIDRHLFGERAAESEDKP